MKKISILLICSTLAAAAFSQGTKTQTGHQVQDSAKQNAVPVKAAAPTVDSTEKLFTLQGTFEAFQVLIQALDQSNASHVTVEALKQWILPSLNKQLPAAAR
jgi:hypothetical protein